MTEISELPTPLTRGEMLTLDLLRDGLSDEWEIYVQPHLNGLRPDFVLLHEIHGIAVYEVKDWNLQALDYFYADVPPRLYGRRDGRRFSLAADDPMMKVAAYKEEISELYCPSLPNRVGFGVITAGVIFPNAGIEELVTLFGDVYRSSLAYDQNVLVGAEVIEQRDIERVFPLHSRQNGSMTTEVAAELRSWLIEPDVSADQRKPLELDRRQQRLATSRTGSGYRRIRGPAGAGKSLVLAARAAELAKEGKTVLVATFNITLLNYLRDLAVRRWRNRSLSQNVTWLNFHQWCKRIAIVAGERDQYKHLWAEGWADRDDILNSELPELIVSLYGRDGQVQLPRYDAILVDEGQDYRLKWWNALRQSLNDGGEMLLVADPTQDLYETAAAWTEEAMTGAGFPGGQWTTLKSSYRLPPALIPLTRDFAERFLPHKNINILAESPQVELPLGQTHLRWFQVPDNRSEEASVAEALRLPCSVPGRPIAWADLTLLVIDKEVGARIVQRLQSHGIRVLHTFYSGSEERRRKLAFYKGAANPKATTIHSFKGWESNALVVCLGDAKSDRARSAAYAAMTRLKRSDHASVLSVVCSCDGLEEYGKSWPEFYTWEGQGLGVDGRVLEDYDEVWRPIIAALAAMSGLTVEPGEEVMQDGRVVDLDLATIQRNDKRVRIVDDTRDTANAVAVVLEEAHESVIRIRPDDPEVVDRVLSVLER
jgi:hypothetical protein